MKILFLSSGKQVPSSRFRIRPYVRLFEADGHTCSVAHSFPAKYDYFPWMGFRPSQLLKRSVRWWHWLKARLRHYDIVYIDREIFDNASSGMEDRFRDACGRLVLDIDDGVFLRYPEKFIHLFRTADLVVCGNQLLVQHVSEFNSNTVHVPTSVDLNEYPLRDWNSQPSTQPIVGWMGTSGNLRYLAVAAEALRVVAGEFRFRLHIVAPDISVLQTMDLSGVSLSSSPWNASSEQHELRQFEIGLMPLFMDQDWDRYKCGAKLIQYLATGVPGIASPVGVNHQIIHHAESGFTPKTTDEWITALRSLLGDPNLRRDMGLRGRRTVEELYSVQANYPVLRDALLNLLHQGSS
ncbi:MAG: glycosyltransferase family 4 protein [Planctomyces sp.]|nr:glycosyltransferase family 4 protein [Planctomyces sp.]